MDELNDRERAIGEVAAAEARQLCKHLEEQWWLPTLVDASASESLLADMASKRRRAIYILEERRRGREVGS